MYEERRELPNPLGLEIPTLQETMADTSTNSRPPYIPPTQYSYSDMEGRVYGLERPAKRKRSDADDDVVESGGKRLKIPDPYEKSVVHFLFHRKGIGRKAPLPCPISQQEAFRWLLRKNHLSEFSFSGVIGHVDRVVSVAWVSDNKFACATLCRKVLLVDVPSRECVEVPPIEGSEGSESPPNNCCSFLSPNPNNSLLACTASSPENVGIYSLPGFDPKFLGEGAHPRVVTDVAWVENEKFASISEDGTIALWSMDKPRALRTALLKRCQNPRKIVYNPLFKEFAVVGQDPEMHSGETQIRLVDATSLEALCSRGFHCRLPDAPATLALSPDKRIYAVGSGQHLYLLDARTLQSLGKTVSKTSPVPYIMSVNFIDDRYLTMSTSTGIVVMYDYRSMHMVLSENTRIALSETVRGPGAHFESTGVAQIRVSSGWRQPSEEEQSRNRSRRVQRPMAICHAFDYSRRRLLVGGGFSAGTLGNYVALWH